MDRLFLSQPENGILPKQKQIAYCSKYYYVGCFLLQVMCLLKPPGQLGGPTKHVGFIYYLLYCFVYFISQYNMHFSCTVQTSYAKV